MSAISIIGTVAFDTIQTPKETQSKILGGSASFSSFAAALFSRVSISSIVGNDFPDTHFDIFKQMGISTKGIQHSSQPTFHWEGYYEGSMNQAYTTATHLNSLLEFTPIIPEEDKDAEIVFCANIDPSLQLKAIQQFHDPKLIVLDTMNYWIENQRDALINTLQYVDVLIINDQELQLLTGISNIIAAMPEVLNLGPQRVIIKKGEHGAIMLDKNQYFICPALPLKTLVDPTGAGDSFAGGICGYLAKYGWDNNTLFRKAIVAGTLISAYTVQGFSLTPLQGLSLDELEKSYHQFKQFTQLSTTLF